MDAALMAMLVTPIQHAAYLSQDAYGTPTYGALQTHLGKVEYRQRKVVDAHGIERLSRARVFLAADVAIDLQDKVVLPDGTSPPLVDVREVFDEDGSRHHWEILF